MTDLERAICLLHANDSLKCVLQKGDVHYESEKRGVAPMLDFLSKNTDLVGFSAADRVVGKATAYLFVLAGVCAVYADVMSEGAETLLQAHGITYRAQKVVPYIINRQGTGMCPMESAVLDATCPADAYRAILDTMKKLRENERKQ